MFKDVRYSIGKQDRFYQSPSAVRAKSLVPSSYMNQESFSNFNDKVSYKKVSIGYGKKRFLKTGKHEQETPGPAYNTHLIKAIGNLSHINTNLDSSFGA